MKAKEMFYELGYYDFFEDEAEIIFSKSFRLRFKEITFNKLFKSISIGKNITCDYTHILTIDEIKAINKQVEELGWN